MNTHIFPLQTNSNIFIFRNICIKKRVGRKGNYVLLTNFHILLLEEIFYAVSSRGERNFFVSGYIANTRIHDKSNLTIFREPNRDFHIEILENVQSIITVIPSFVRKTILYWNTYDEKQ